MLPFTREQFFAVFEQYNLQVWPAQVFLYVLTVMAISLAASRRVQSRVVLYSWLGALWLWGGVAYHFTFFTRINPAAWLFGSLFVLEGCLLLWFAFAARGVSVAPPSVRWRWAGTVLVVYALVLYPLLGVAAGDELRRLPVLGAPCPTTILTFGVFCWLLPRPPRLLLVVPLLWAFVGATAAFTLDVPQDVGLLAAGLAGLPLLARRRLLARPAHAPAPAVHRTA